MGTVIWRLGNNEQWTIGGVYRDFPDNCSMQNHVYNNLANYQADNWTEYRYFAYLQLRDPRAGQQLQMKDHLLDLLIGNVALAADGDHLLRASGI